MYLHATLYMMSSGGIQMPLYIYINIYIYPLSLLHFVTLLNHAIDQPTHNTP